MLRGKILYVHSGFKSEGSMPIESEKHRKADGTVEEVSFSESDVVASGQSMTSVLGPQELLALSDTSPIIIIPSASPNSFIIPTMITTVNIARTTGYVKKKGGVPTLGWTPTFTVSEFDDSYLLNKQSHYKVERPESEGDPFALMQYPFCLFVPSGVTYTDGDGICVLTVRYDLIVL
jgi:hypothetical protein